MFAVVDVETTGLFTSMHDRVAEVAVVRVDAGGRIVDRWETLVNPQRDLGPQRIHRISAAEILDAPTFAEVAPALTEVLQGCIMVAHNLRFDADFLGYEFTRAGIGIPDGFLQGLCTMRLAHDYVIGNARSLAHCCEFFSIENYRAHCAGDDAEAAAGLLGRYIDLDPDRAEWTQALEVASLMSWPSNRSGAAAFVPHRRRAEGAIEKHFLSRITVHMPEYTGPEEHDQYLALLGQAMLDLHLSVHETRALVRLADELGISQDRCRKLHAYYVEQLAVAAWADGIITPNEEAELYQAAKLLDVDSAVVEYALAQPPAAPATAAPVTGRIALGSTLVLTGAMTRERSELSSFLTEMGYVVAERATKKTDLVVAADPDSLSGKAAKARQYGIPVVGESFLYDVLGVPSF
ncbi:bifunctional ATP-dependent DNA helicase/DNA polymerase III subunit epsilon (plasmid) [Arthrobacter sp. ZXY-2]|nr:bifunctional ATP-dependent DNA helicase/DNA polymerase III subunit epsilon [Arthrobacter sp. ZXY-2]